MVIEIRIKTLDADSIPIQNAAIRFIASDKQIPGKNPPTLVGGQVDATGTFVLTYEFGVFDFWFYDLEVTARGYETTVKKYFLIHYGAKAIEDSVVLQPEGLPIDVVQSGLPELISIQQPPSILFKKLPYIPHCTVETSIISATGERTPLITPVNADGTVEVVLSESFRMEPIPTLVPYGTFYLADKSLSMTYDIVCHFVTGRLRRALKTWKTTVLYVDHSNPSDLLGKWLPSSNFTIERNTYVDAMILLPKGSQTVYYQNNVTTLFTRIVESDGNTLFRFRLPDIANSDRFVRISLVKDGKNYGETLTVNFR